MLQALVFCGGVVAHFRFRIVCAHACVVHFLLHCIAAVHMDLVCARRNVNQLFAVVPLFYLVIFQLSPIDGFI